MGATVGIIAGMASAASAVGGMVSGSSSGSQAEQYAQSQATLAGSQAKLADTQANIANSQWSRYMSTFAPLENKLVRQVSKPLSENAAYLSNMADVKQNYANSGSNLRRVMGGRYQNGSGVETAYQAQNERAKIKTLADTTATAEQNRLNQMYQVSNLGRGISSSAQSGLSSASSSLNSASSTYGSLANMYNNAANSAYSSSGNSIGNLAQMYMLSGSSGGSSNWLSNMFGGSSGNYVTNIDSSSWNPLTWG